MITEYTCPKSQQKKRLPFILIGCVIFSFLLYGCVSVKDFNANREQYLLEQFDISKLPHNVRNPIERAFVDESKFNKIVMEFDETETNINGTVTHHTLSKTIYGRAHGLTLVQDEWSANGIPYRVNDSIQLLDLNLDEQYIFQNQKSFQTTQDNFIVKGIDSIDPSPVVFDAGSRFTVKYKTGLRTQFINLNRFSDTYSFGKRFPASQINAALQGDALTCEEEDLNDSGTVVSRSESIYLLNYGFAIVTEYSDSSVQITYSPVKSVAIE